MFINTGGNLKKWLFLMTNLSWNCQGFLKEHNLFPAKDEASMLSLTASNVTKISSVEIKYSEFVLHRTFSHSTHVQTNVLWKLPNGPRKCIVSPIWKGWVGTLCTIPCPYLKPWDWMGQFDLEEPLDQREGAWNPSHLGPLEVLPHNGADELYVTGRGWNTKYEAITEYH